MIKIHKNKKDTGARAYFNKKICKTAGIEETTKADYKVKKGKIILTIEKWKKD